VPSAGFKWTPNFNSGLSNPKRLQKSALKCGPKPVFEPVFPVESSFFGDKMPKRRAGDFILISVPSTSVENN